MKIKNLTGHEGLRLKAENVPHTTTTRISGRLSVVTAFFVFLVCYLSGIIHYGVVSGIAIGWLPSVLVAWLCAHAIFDLTQLVLRVLPPLKQAKTEKL